jgi:hypothetical protein
MDDDGFFRFRPHVHTDRSANAISSLSPSFLWKLFATTNIHHPPEPPFLPSGASLATRFDTLPLITIIITFSQPNPASLALQFLTFA